MLRDYFFISLEFHFVQLVIFSFFFLSKVTICQNFSCSPTYKNIQNFHSMKLGKLETFSDVYFPICKLKHEKIRQRKTACQIFSETGWNRKGKKL